MGDNLTDQYKTDLLSAADTYRAAGWSVIPVVGYLSRKRGNPKRPVCSWAQFQHERPTDQQHADIFDQQRRAYGGLAIITGAVSGLVALDLDRADQLTALVMSAPDLADTYAVRTPTRGGYHLYYRLGADLQGVPVPSRAGVGGELSGDGRYILAPPTMINKSAGVAYRAMRAGQPIRTINRAELDRLYAAVGAPVTIGGIKPSRTPAIAARAGGGAAADQPAAPLAVREVAALDLPSMFTRLAERFGGRNHGLYRAALYARSRGIDRDTAAAVLSPAFITASAPDHHRRETDGTRYRELLATVSSAYAAPVVTLGPPAPRSTPTSAQHDRPAGAIPNRIRERLLSAGLAGFARLYEAALMGGITDGQHVTSAQIASAAARGGVSLSARQVGYALKTAAARGALYRAQPLADEPTAAQPLAIDQQQHGQPPAVSAGGVLTPSKLYTVSVTFLSLNPAGRGRPAYTYVWPSVGELAELLGTDAGELSDALDTTDLTSAKTYRRGLHAAFARRADPSRAYTRTYLARRLGVTRKTLNTYETIHYTDQTGQRAAVRIIKTAVARRETPISTTAADGCRTPAGLLAERALFDSPAGRRMVRGCYVDVRYPDGRAVPIAPDAARVNWFLTHRPACRLVLVEVVGVRLLGTLAADEVAALARLERGAVA